MSKLSLSVIALTLLSGISGASAIGAQPFIDGGKSNYELQAPPAGAVVEGRSASVASSESSDQAPVVVPHGR
jgi:hypothetical protein